MSKKKLQPGNTPAKQPELSVLTLQAQNAALADEVLRLQDDNARLEKSVDVLHKELALLRQAMTAGAAPKPALQLAPLKPFDFEGQRFEWTRRRFRAYGREHDVHDVQKDPELLQQVMRDFPQIARLIS